MTENLPYVRETFALRDGPISALRFGDPDAPPRLLFLHANGFHAHCYQRIFAALDCPAIVLDMRGHGQSQDLPTDVGALTNWHIFRDDAIEFAQAHMPKRFVLAGHSFGSVSGILSAPALTANLAGYVGFDPVTLPAYFRWVSGFRFWRESFKKRVPIARNAGRRKSVFDSPEAAFERYQGRGAFRGMPDEILRDYIEGGLRQVEDGSWHLACDPKWEQAIFAAQHHDLFEAAHALPDNSRVIYAGKYGAVSTPGLRRALQRKQPNISVEFDPELAHLFPLNHPDLAVKALQSVLDKAVF
ncbi:alpha/beta hydrolase [Litorimonas sp. RW-G-Af-16]